MTGEYFSMREASRVLGVSQLRVRELIRKGTLEADKVSDDAGEHWKIVSASVREFMNRRLSATQSSNGQVAEVAAQSFAGLIATLDQHLSRMRSLADELTRAQALLGPMRDAQRALEIQLAQLRQPKAPATPRPEAAPPVKTRPQPTKADRPEPKPEAKTKSQPGPEPKAEAKAKAPAKPRPAAASKPPKAEAPRTKAEPKPRQTAAKIPAQPKAAAARTNGAKPEAKLRQRGNGAKPAGADTAIAAALREAGVAVTAPKAAKKR